MGTCSSLRRRMMMGGSEKPIPYDAEVWYIENTNMQYIDTGFKPNQDTRIVAKMKCLTNNTYPRLFGAGMYNAKGGVQIDFEQYITGNLKIKYGGNTGWTTVSSVRGDYNVHIYDYNKNVFYFDGEQVSSATYSSFQSTSNLGIFNYINGNTSGGTHESFKGALFYFQIYDNDVLIRDFIPVRVGQVGYLYDKVSGKLFGNAGTGSFSIGPDKPIEYYELAYLRNPSTAYINTNVYADSDTYIEIGFKISQIPSSGLYPMPFGRRVNASSGLYEMLYSGSSSYMRYSYNNAEHDTGLPNDTNVHNVKFGNGKLIIDDDEVASLQGVFTSNTYPLLLFAGNGNGSSSVNAPFIFKGDIFYCRIYQNGTLIRDYVPYLRCFDATRGMLDKTNNVFYQSAAVSPFT